MVFRRRRVPERPSRDYHRENGKVPLCDACNCIGQKSTESAALVSARYCEAAQKGDWDHGAVYG